MQEGTIPLTANIPTLEQLLALAKGHTDAEGRLDGTQMSLPVVLRVSPDSFKFKPSAHSKTASPDSKESNDSNRRNSDAESEDVNELDFEYNHELDPETHTDQQRHDHAVLRLAAQVIATTQFPVGFPTETVYGLGANACSEAAVANIFYAKGRPADNPLIVHVSSLRMARSVSSDAAVLGEGESAGAGAGGRATYGALLKRHWPGPLSVLVPRCERQIPAIVTAGHGLVAVRLPAHPVARALIGLAQTPVAAPSANTSTRPSPTRASHVRDDLRGRLLLLIDGGDCDDGLESSVVDALRSATVPPELSPTSLQTTPTTAVIPHRIPPCLLRPGGISIEMLRKIKGFEDCVVWSPKLPSANKNDTIAPVTPGMKYKHYSPNVPLVLLESHQDETLYSKQQYREAISIAISARISAFLEKTPTKIITSPATIVILRTLSQSDFALNLPRSLPPQVTILQKSLGDSTAKVAHELFAALRDCETLYLNCLLVFIEGVAEADEGLAVMNRLRKAAGETIFFHE
ncbi:hypothetical protein HK100_003061 [Physocladia obscura]|uniref:Threonylcarbamoyl-AMP synthase n=1 Tax=Physocladia obscura TaxID=109957 RepID=A0AAD5XL99_9FUNG|nr:hypothetical protein HK100_003061 [Physocladia obscura]